MIAKLNWVQDTVLECVIQEIILNPVGEMISTDEVDESLLYLKYNGFMDKWGRPTPLALAYRARNAFHVERAFDDVNGGYRDEIRRQYEDLESQAMDMEDELQDVRSNIDSVENRIENLETDLVGLRQEVDEKEINLKKLKNYIDELETNAYNTEDDLEDIRRDIRDMEDEHHFL